jgi:arginase family enzyme
MVLGELAQDHDSPMQLAFIGVPYTLYDDRLVRSRAWHAWRSGGLMELVAPYAERALWVSLPEISEDLDAPTRRGMAFRRVRDTVRTVHATGTVPVLLGGDSRLVGLGMLAGLQQSGESPGIAWFDANSPLGPDEALGIATEPGRNPLGAELGLGEAVPPWHILLAGIRNVDAPKLAQIEDSDMTIWDAEDLNEGGATDLGRDMAHWPPLLLQIDLAVLDPAVMPAVRQPAPNGLSLAALIASLEGVMAGGRVVATGVSNYVPERDEDELGLTASMQVVQEAVRILTI